MDNHHTHTIVFEKIEILRVDYLDLIDAAKDLKGEDAIESVFNLIKTADDEYYRNEALYSIVQFYSKVRFLVLRINQIFEECQKENEKLTTIVQ